ncbi:unnamed protein product [Urochloa humidicola]
MEKVQKPTRIHESVNKPPEIFAGEARNSIAGEEAGGTKDGPLQIQRKPTKPERTEIFTDVDAAGKVGEAVVVDGTLRTPTPSPAKDATQEEETKSDRRNGKT